MTMTKSAMTAVGAVIATLAAVLVFVFVPTNSAGAAGYTDWTNEGPVVTTHDNVAPGTDTDTVRWLPVGEPTKHVTVEAVAAGPWLPSGEPVTTEENVAPGPAGENCRWQEPVRIDDDSEDIPAVQAVEGQHYSLKGNSGIEGDQIPVPPTPTDDGYWQPNTDKHEPHLQGNGNPATWYPTDPATSGLHYTSNNGNGKRDWFYYRAPVEGKDKVEGYDYRWQKECQTPAVAEVSHFDYKWQKQVRTVITDNPTTPTETVTVTPPVPTETQTVTPPVPTETVTETPEPETPETPVTVPSPETPEEENPEPTKPPRSTPQPPKDVQVIACVDGVWTTQVNGETISESGSCVETPENNTFQTFSETGL